MEVVLMVVLLILISMSMLYFAKYNMNIKNVNIALFRVQMLNKWLMFFQTTVLRVLITSPQNGRTHTEGQFRICNQ